MEKEINQLLADDQLEEAVGGVGGTGYIDGFICCGNCNNMFIRSENDIIEESISVKCPHCNSVWNNVFELYAGRCHKCGYFVNQEDFEYHSRRLIRCPTCRTNLDGNEITWLAEPFIK